MNASDKAHFRVSPRVLEPLGAEQLQDPALAVLELVKNSWDADATKVLISVHPGTKGGVIAVRDNGHGMTVDDFRERWLVIGISHKRGEETSENGRPLIGEKGLGRLSSSALGREVVITSAREGKRGFVARVNWEDLKAARTLEDYLIPIEVGRARAGTRIEIRDLRAEWQQAHTDFLVTHAEFLASIPGQRFSIALRVGRKRYAVKEPVQTISQLAEATLEMQVSEDGKPTILSSVVNGKNETGIVYREMKGEEQDKRLAGMRLSLKFFRRDEAARKLSNVLARNEITAVLERYQGIRIFRDGINVPPYGLNRDDWAGLEKQRTSTGGPTLVPGNSQLIGEIHLSRRKHGHLVVTAGRSGFSDQSAVAAMANYVRWAVRELGTARRAEHLGISGSNKPIPGRVDAGTREEGEAPERVARKALAEIAAIRAVRLNAELRQRITQASELVGNAFDRNEDTLRLYAQLASTGIAATSFAHELRGEFDVVTEAVDTLRRQRGRLDKEGVDFLVTAWKRIASFAALFKLVPVKVRRQAREMTSNDVRKAAESILGLAPPDKVNSEVAVELIRVKVVPAELDAILLNLVSNAVKAIAESPNRESGLIRVSITPAAADLDIRVADNGSGITPKVAAIMFEPLEGRFSEGTGMGLPIVKFIAERYRGHVAVEHSPPKGFKTELMVRLRGVVL